MPEKEGRGTCGGEGDGGNGAELRDPSGGYASRVLYRSRKHMTFFNVLTGRTYPLLLLFLLQFSLVDHEISVYS